MNLCLKLCRLLLPCCLALLLCPCARAEEEPKEDRVLQAQADALDLAGLQAAGGAWEDFAVGIDLDDGLRTILDTGSGHVFGILRKALRSGALLLAIVLLGALADGLGGARETAVDAVTIAGALAVTAVAVTDVNALVGLGREALGGMETFSKVLMPTMTAAAAASGSPAVSVARQLATMLFSDVLMTLINRLLLPLVYAYVAACAVYAALGNEGLKRIAALLKWVVTAALTAIVLLFVGYLTVSGAIAGSTDAMTLKAARLTLSGMVPVVGGILSDAAETVLVGAGLLKNAVGVFGMLVVLSICLVPFLQLGVHYLVYKMTAALTATVSSGRISDFIERIGGAFGLVLGMTGASALLLLVSMVSAISVAHR